ncbi:MAG: nucleotidyltransferase family protein [Patescibacteria group bacterium]|nr:nucleotidyltransferase family protein [Patescibacteria group bacterium]
MTEQGILNLIENDPWMMKIIHIAADLNLPNWIIGAGFVRNKVWDHLHSYSRTGVDTADIDLVYYDPLGNNQQADEKLSRQMEEKTGIAWEIVNQFYAHVWNDLPPYGSAENAIAQWPETATGIGVRIEDGKLRLLAPHGIDDLVNLIVRPSPTFREGIAKVKERAEKKQWFKKWPKLKFAD